MAMLPFVPVSRPRTWTDRRSPIDFGRL